MTRSKQIRIPGTERPDHPEIEEAALAYIDVRDERASLSKKESLKKLEMAAVMNSLDVRTYKFYDERAGRYRIARIATGEDKILVEDTDEAVGDIGASVPTGGDVPQSLIDQALADDTHVEVTADGDVVVPDTAVPRKKSRSKGKKKS